MENIGKPKYGLLDSGIFGLRIVAGIVTGIQYTEDKPLYQIRFGKDCWWSSKIADSPEELIKFFELASLERIEKTHELKIKFNV